MTTVKKQPVTRVTLYRSRGEWCYAAWTDAEYDHSDVVDVLDDATESEARAQLAGEFPGANIERVSDVIAAQKWAVTYTADVEGDWTDVIEDHLLRFGSEQEAREWWAKHYRGPDEFGNEAYPEFRLVD